MELFSGCEPPGADEPCAGSAAEQGERASLDALLRRELRHGEGGGGGGGARAREVAEQGTVDILEAENVGSFVGDVGSWIRTPIGTLNECFNNLSHNRPLNILQNIVHCDNRELIHLRIYLNT